MKTENKRLTVDIPEECHKRLKYIALEHNISLKALMMRWIYENIQKQDEIDGTKLDK